MFRSRKRLDKQEANMSIEKPNKSLNNNLNEPSLKTSMVGISNPTTIQPFLFKIGEQIDETDSAKAWSYNIPVLSANQKSIYIKTQSFQATILGYVGSDFPKEISIGLRNFAGLQGSSGVPTNKIISLSLSNISGSMNEGIQTRDLTYRNQFENLWNIGNLRTLELQIYLDDEPLPLQLPIDTRINIMFKIVHTS